MQGNKAYINHQNWFKEKYLRDEKGMMDIENRTKGLMEGAILIEGQRKGKRENFHHYSF